MTALYLERYLNWGLTREELQAGRPIIGIAQSGSDLAPCNRHHLELAQRVREGIRDAGGIVLEFPILPIQETGRRPTAMLDRNLAYLGARRDALRLSARRRRPHDRLRQDDAVAAHGGRDRQHPGHRALGRTDAQRLVRGAAGGLRARSSGRPASCMRRDASTTPSTSRCSSSAAPSPGFCNTMGTATTMNSLAEVLGMMLHRLRGHPGGPPRPWRGRLSDRASHRRDGRSRTSGRPTS